MHYKNQILGALFAAAIWFHPSSGNAVESEVVFDIPTRPGVSQRILYLPPSSKPRAAVILFTGGHGGLNIFPNGSIGWAEKSFLVRNRSRFSEQGLAVVLLDAPSDKRSGLSGFRDTAEHATDVGIVINWLREKTGSQVWLVGHSRGTESVVSSAIRLGTSPKGPDGLVLASSILSSSMFVTGSPVTKFPLEQLNAPLLVLHHEADSCSVTLPRDLPSLISKLPTTLPKKSVQTLTGGHASGSLCDMDSHHSYAGQDEAVIGSIVKFILD